MPDEPQPIPPTGDPTLASPPRRRRRKRRITLWTVGIIVGLAVVGALLPKTPAPTPTAPAGASAMPSAPAAHVATPTPSPLTPAPVPVPVPTKPAPAVAPPPADPLTGYGATIDAWDAHHTADTTYLPGSVYNPDPSLPQANGRTWDKYIAVTPLGGRVTNYTINFLPTSLAGAKTIMAPEFPADTHVLWTHNADTCAQVEYASAIVHGLLGNTDVGDALVQYNDVQADGSSAPNPTTFNQALVTNLPGAQPDPSTTC